MPHCHSGPLEPVLHHHGAQRSHRNPTSLDIPAELTFFLTQRHSPLEIKCFIHARFPHYHFYLTFERLIQGESVLAEIDEQIIYDQLSVKKNAVWSLLLAGGYLKVKDYRAYMTEYGVWKEEYELALTNLETRIMFVNMVREWFDNGSYDYNEFIRALMAGDVRTMNVYMNRVSSEMFSSFDTGNRPSERQPERFYHGFVLGLIVELADRYVVTSNRESGLGRYDVMLEPRNTENDAIILEFKVQDEDEKELSDTVKKALWQIEERGYQANLLSKGIPEERIRRYGFAFCGKKVLIGSDNFQSQGR